MFCFSGINGDRLHYSRFTLTGLNVDAKLRQSRETFVSLHAEFLSDGTVVMIQITEKNRGDDM